MAHGIENYVLFSLGLNAAASGGGSRKGLFFCVRGGGVGVPLGVAECGSPRVGQILKKVWQIWSSG